MRTEDGHIIYKCLNEDPAAFGLLVDKYKESIYALAYSKLGNFHDAEDVTQEVFIKAFRKLHTLRRWDNFLSWLYAITSNLCKDLIRSRSRRPDRDFVEDQKPEVLDNPSIDSYRNNQAQESLYETVHDALNLLPEIYRQVLVLYYLGGMSNKEVAKFLGMSADAVNHRLKRGRDQLKEEILAMISTSYQQHKLQAGFTFRIVEMVKRIKIQSTPHTPWIPWGISLVTGIIITMLSSASNYTLLNPVIDFITAESHEMKISVVDTSLKHDSQNGEMLAYADFPVIPWITAGGGDGTQYSKNHAQISYSPGTKLIGQQQNQTQQTGQSLPSGTSKVTISDTAEKVTISGKVLRDNVPVPGALASILTETGIISVTTKDDGSFQLDIPKPDDTKWDSLAIIAQHPQHSFGWTKLSKDNTTNVVIRLRQPMEITGTVVNGSGDPIDGVKIQMGTISLPNSSNSRDPRGDYLYGDIIPTSIVKTDTNGKFIFQNLPAGSTANLDVIGQGYAKERLFSIQSNTTGIMLKLKPEGRIEGHVISGETGKPVKGIKVGAMKTPDLDERAKTQTDDKGYYALTNLAASEYTVALAEDYPDWTAAPRENIRVTEGQVVKNIDLKLVKGGFVAGMVTDKDTNKPISGHYINFMDAGGRYHNTKADENGAYRFRSAPGRTMVYTSAPAGYDDVGQVQKYADVVDGATAGDVNFQFRKGKPKLSITGRTISIDGESVAGAQISDRVNWFQAYGTSDKDGEFTITGLVPGQKLSIKAEQRELQLRGDAYAEVQPDTELEIIMERYETTSVSGRVVDQQGKPIPSAKIDLMVLDKEQGRGSSSSAGMADSSGKYTINGLIIGGEYRVSANADGYRGAGTGMFTATADMPPLTDIALPIAGKFFLEGTIKDTDGKPVVGARVTPVSAMESMANTDSSGHYRLDNLPFAVVVEIQIFHPDYGFSSFVYIPTNQTQDFIIAKADVYLSGKVVDADGNLVGGANVSLDASREELGHANLTVQTNAQGEFRLEHLVADKKESIGVSKDRLYKMFKDVEMNRDDVTFTLNEETPPEPPKPPTAEETAKREYANKAMERMEQLKGKPALELDVAQWIYGKPVTLAELKGKVVLLHFWESQNKNSAEALPFLDTLQKVYGEKGLVCISIHGYTAKIDELKKFIKEKQIAYRIAVDKELSVVGAKGVTFDKYAVARLYTGGTPGTTNTILIDRNGTIYGQTYGRELEGKIQELLSK